MSFIIVLSNHSLLLDLESDRDPHHVMAKIPWVEILLFVSTVVRTLNTFFGRNEL